MPTIRDLVGIDFDPLPADLHERSLDAGKSHQFGARDLLFSKGDLPVEVDDGVEQVCADAAVGQQRAALGSRPVGGDATAPTLQFGQQ